MAFVQREANWSAQTGASGYRDGDRSRKNGAAERSTQLAPVNHPVLRGSTSRVEGDESCTTAMDGGSGSRREFPTTPAFDASMHVRNAGAICTTAEIVVEPAEAQTVIVLAITSDQELRSALTEVLPQDGIVFAESAEEVLGNPAPNNCGVLVVEQTLSRPTFEQLKSHLKASAPALVNIMVGTQADGSSLINLLSAGSIDRFMVKPLKHGPTRCALRSALQQHHSLRPRLPVDRETSNIPVTESAPSPVSDAHVSAASSTHDQMYADQPKVLALTQQPKPAHHARSESLKRKLDVELENTSNAIEPGRDSAIRATTPKKLPPSWSMAFAAMIVVAGLVGSGVIAWTLSTRAPQVDVNKAIVNKVVADHLAAAQSAFALGSYVDPPELSATHFYNAALELDPQNDQARRGLDAVADRLIADAKQHIDTGDLLRAQSTLDNVRRMQPKHRELVAVTASLLSARDTERLTIQAAHSAAKPTLDPIAATASRAAPAKAPVVVKPSASVERKVDTGSQRQQRAAQASSPALGTQGTALTKTSQTATSVASATDASLASIDGATQTARTTKVNDDLAGTTLKGAGTATLVAPAQDEAAQRAITKVATAEVATTPSAVGASIASSTVAISSTPSGSATSAANSKPVLLKYVPPVYPFKARSEGFEGWLDVTFLVTGEGRVVNPQVQDGTLDKRFHRAALAAVTQWKFAPAQNDAKTHRLLHVRLEFKLTD